MTKNLREIPAEEEQPLTKEEKAFFDFLLKEGWLEKDQEFLDGHAITDEYIIVNTPSLDEVPDCVRALKRLCESYAKHFLSSELSLAIKSLREAVEEQMRPPKNWTCNCTEYRRDANECTCGAEYDQMKTSYDGALSSFDSKAKEILGESS